jgi:23S rRNA pseudoU1915 N3-methylase RlmH
MDKNQLRKLAGLPPIMEAAGNYDGESQAVLMTESAKIDIDNQPEVIEAKNRALKRLAAEDREAILKMLPTADWNIPLDASGAAKEISSEKYAKLLDAITSTAVHKVVNTSGTSARYSVKGNHLQKFLQSAHNKYSFHMVNAKHPDQTLPGIVSFKNLHTGEESYYQVDLKAAVTKKPKDLYTLRR